MISVKAVAWQLVAYSMMSYTHFVRCYFAITVYIIIYLIDS